MREKVLKYIVATRKKRGYSPTLAEICKHFGWKSKNAAAYHVRKLAVDGKLFNHGVAGGLVPRKP